MKENEMNVIAGFINSAVSCYDNDSKLEAIRIEVKDLCGKFPLYTELI